MIYSFFVNKIINALSRRYFNYINNHKKFSDKEIETLFDNNQLLLNMSRIRKKGKINVAFFCMSLSLWKYETIFKEMLSDPYYNPIFFIAPRNDIWSKRKNDIKQMKNYCQSNKFQYVKLKNNIFNIGHNINNYNIDIAFYTQPYYKTICREYDFDKLSNSLLCYVPYAFLISKEVFCYNSLLEKIAWKIFYPTFVNYKIAVDFNIHNDKIIISGYPGYDMFVKAECLKWKKNGLKRIIWAPHHSIQNNSWVHLSNFLLICDYMLYIAKKYKDKIQIAFKPHPHLYQTLCNLWGENKTRDYYLKWINLENGFLCDYQNYELFKSSDCLIHDCGSFIMEYLYTGKPCLYLTLNGPIQIHLDDQGIKAYNAHYHAMTNKDIEKFITNVVIENNDPKFEDRKYVFNHYITTSNGISATKNILNTIKQCLKVE